MRNQLVYADLSIFFWYRGLRDRLCSYPPSVSDRLVQFMPGGFIGMGRERNSFRLTEFRFDIDTHATEAGSYIGRGMSYFTVFRNKGAKLENPYEFSITIDPATLAVRCEQHEHITVLGVSLPVFTGQISRDLDRLNLRAQSEPPGTEFIFKLSGLPRE